MSGKKAAIILSRQAMYPSLNEKWVRMSIRAIEWVKANDLILNSSTGMQTWELLTALASIKKMTQRIFLLSDDGREQGNIVETVISEFDLKQDKVEFIMPPAADAATTKIARLQLRDRSVIVESDILLPISIRVNGQMDALLSKACSQGKEIVDLFRIPYHRRKTKISYRIDTDCLNPHLLTLDNKYLIHWTRACSGPWPDERKIDYYQAMISAEKYPRSGFDTLRHILTGGKIIASDRHMPVRTRTVSFSGLAPTSVLPLMKWRARYHQMSFEPYGLAVDKEIARKVGIKKVKYYDRTKDKIPTNVDPWRCQSIGTQADWRAEDEYRHLGDFNLTNIPSEKLIVVCLNSREANIISKEFRIPSVSILAD